MKIKKKFEVWSTARADKEFSLWVRKRDGKCKRCGKIENLQCSHYWSRMHSATRYDPKNCIALCAGCHLYHWEIEKQGDYQEFMKKWLGEKEYQALKKRAHSTKPRKEAIKEFMKWYEQTN